MSDSPRPWYLRWPGLVAGLFVLGLVVNTFGDDDADTEAAAAPMPSPAPEPAETPAAEEPEQEPEPEPSDETDWLAAYHDSFGCGDDHWVECFDATTDPFGADLAMKVMSVTSIESPVTDAFEVYMQTDDIEHAVSVCNYVRDLWTDTDGKPTVHVFGADGSILARTRLLDGHACA